MAHVTITREGGIALCTMLPPGGFMTATTVAELDAAVSALAGDGEVRAIVLTGGEEGVFIRHYDVRELEQTARALRAKGAKFSPERPVRERAIDVLFRRLGDIGQPVIAAINGMATGGGLELALACDIRIAEDGPFELGLPEVRLGILPGAGGTQRLAQVVGVARALEMILRGRTVSPREAAALGIVHEAVAGSARQRALAVAREIAARPARAVAHIKRLVRQGGPSPREENLAAERTIRVESTLLESKEPALR